MQVLLESVAKRAIPKSTCGAVFLLTRGDWMKRINALQDKICRQILGVETRLSRLVLLHETGSQYRLSTVIIAQAVNLMAQIHCLPAEHIAARVAAWAGMCTAPTWTAQVTHLQEQMCIPTILEWQEDRGFTGESKGSLKSMRKTYMAEAVWPRCADHEAEWQQQQVACLSPVSAADLQDADIPVASIQAWSQLRLQGFYSHAAWNPQVRCVLCKQIATATWEHWSEHCRPMQDFFCKAQWPADACDRDELLFRPATYEQAAQAVQMATRMKSLLQNAWQKDAA